jgi:hypothetical protein
MFYLHEDDIYTYILPLKYTTLIITMITIPIAVDTEATMAVNYM